MKSRKKRKPPHDSHVRDASHVKEALGERASLPFYKVEWFEEQGSGRRSAPWLLWSPPAYRKARSDLVKKAEKVEDRIRERRELSPDFLLRTEDGEVFRPYLAYGNPEERKAKIIRAVEETMREELTANGSVPASEAARLKNIREDLREGVENCCEELQHWILTPLRKAAIACLLEEYRNEIGFGKWRECGRRTRNKWRRTVERANVLLREGVVRGRPLDTVLDMGRAEEAPEVSASIFDRIPRPMASGFRAALRLYLPKKYFPRQEAKREDSTDRSRDGILGRAEPVYFRWLAAYAMHESSIRGERLVEVLYKVLPQSHSTHDSFLEKSLSGGGQSGDELSGDENPPISDGTRASDAGSSRTKSSSNERSQPEKETPIVEKLTSEIKLLPSKEEMNREEVEYIKKISNIIPKHDLSKSSKKATYYISELYKAIDFKEEYDKKSEVYDDVKEYKGLNNIESIDDTIRKSLGYRSIKKDVMPGSVERLVNFSLLYDHFHDIRVE